MSGESELQSSVTINGTPLPPVGVPSATIEQVIPKPLPAVEQSPFQTVQDIGFDTPTTESDQEPATMETPDKEVKDKSGLVQNIDNINNQISQIESGKEASAQEFENKTRPLEQQIEIAKRTLQTLEQKMFVAKRQRSEDVQMFEKQEHKLLQDGMVMVMDEFADLKGIVVDRDEALSKIPNSEGQFEGFYLNRQTLHEQNEQTQYTNGESRDLIREIIDYACENDGEEIDQTVAIGTNAINYEFDHKSDQYAVTINLRNQDGESGVAFLMDYDLSKAPGEQIKVSVWDTEEEQQTPNKITQFEKRFTTLPKQDQITAMALFADVIRDEASGQGRYSYDTTS